MMSQKQDEKKSIPGKFVSQKKRKQRKKWIIAAVIVAALLAAWGISALLRGEQLPLLTLSDTTVLSVGDLRITFWGF